MPIRAKTICNHPGCGSIIDAPGYCSKHFKNKATGWHQTKTTTQRGYGHAWRKIRDYILKRDNYHCLVCAKKNRVSVATQVDHIISKSVGGTDDYSNLQSICVSCHKHKTAVGN